jgi:hypothetical protein
VPEGARRRIIMNRANKAVISLWAENFNGIEDGRKLEGIVNPRFLANFLNTIHYGEDNIVIENTNLPITHVPVGDGFFRKV